MGRTKSKENRIKAEAARLTGLFAGADENKLAAALPLIQRAAFLAVHLEDLEEEINREGWTEEYHNGQAQSGRKKSAAADAHISLTKNLTAICKQLLDLVPPAQKRSKLEEMLLHE